MCSFRIFNDILLIPQRNDEKERSKLSIGYFEIYGYSALIQSTNVFHIEHWPHFFAGRVAPYFSGPGLFPAKGPTDQPASVCEMAKRWTVWNRKFLCWKLFLITRICGKTLQKPFVPLLHAALTCLLFMIIYLSGKFCVYHCGKT